MLRKLRLRQKNRFLIKKTVYFFFFSLKQAFIKLRRHTLLNFCCTYKIVKKEGFPAEKRWTTRVIVRSVHNKDKLHNIEAATRGVL